MRQKKNKVGESWGTGQSHMVPNLLSAVGGERQYMLFRAIKGVIKEGREPHSPSGASILCHHAKVQVLAQSSRSLMSGNRNLNRVLGVWIPDLTLVTFSCSMNWKFTKKATISNPAEPILHDTKVVPNKRRDTTSGKHLSHGKKSCQQCSHSKGDYFEDDGRVQIIYVVWHL